MPATASERRRRGPGVLCALLLALGFAAGPARPDAPPVLGRAAPALVARAFTGETVDLATLRGKVVVLNFWASWCGPCRAEMPALDALYREYRERGVVVVGLSADDPHDRKDALRAAQGVSYLTGMLTEAPTNGFGPPQVLPLTYVIGRGGALSAVLRANRGPLSAEQLRGAVEAALRPAQ